MDDLAIGNRQHADQEDDGKTDGNRPRDSRRAGQDQDQQNFLGGIGYGGNGVGRKDGQRDGLGQPFVRGMGCFDGRPDEQTLQEHGNPLWHKPGVHCKREA